MVLNVRFEQKIKKNSNIKIKGKLSEKEDLVILQ